MSDKIQARRENLKTLEYESAKGGVNPGLLLDRYVGCFNDDHEEQKKLYSFLTESYTAPDCYKTAFSRHYASLNGNTDIDIFIVKSDYRMAVGLGADSVLENSIALNRTYGTPMMPGPALKGLASHFCKTYYGGFCGDEESKIKVCTDHSATEHRAAFLPSPDSWHEAKHSSSSDEEKLEEKIKPYKEAGAVDGKGYSFYDNLFGRQDASGCIVFHDAWWIPTGKSPFLSDVMTVHHQDYYQADTEKGKVPPPADYDSPNPIPFISLGKEVCFLVAIEGAPAWRNWAKDILFKALGLEGIGAKTAIGYGRMKELPKDKWQSRDEIRRILNSDPARNAALTKRADEVETFMADKSNAEVYESLLGMTEPKNENLRGAVASVLLKRKGALKRISKRHSDCIPQLKEWSKRT